MSETLSSPDGLRDRDQKPGRPVRTGFRRLLRWVGAGLVLAAILAAIYGGVAYLAWQRGQDARAENARTALAEELARQMDFAEEDVANGNFALALRRLEWIRERDPDYPGAQALRDQALSGLDVRLTPVVANTPTGTPEASSTPISATDPAGGFAQLERLIDAGDWALAVSAIPAFQSQFPDYRRRETDTMLYNAYIQHGLNLTAGDKVELGLFYLAQAERLGDLPQEIRDQRGWAELYLSGMAFYGVDWSTTIFYFRDLCAAAPFYQDSCATLFEALVALGNQRADAQDWCPAQELFAEAVSIDAVRTVAEQLQEAATLCLQATATPSPSPTATAPTGGGTPEPAAAS